MEYYAIQVRTRAEEKFIRLYAARNPGSAASLHFLRRRLPIRHAGKTTDQLEPVFPGYVFLQVESSLDPVTYRAVRGTDGFFRFLNKEETLVRPLDGKDLKTVLHFLRFGPIAEKSKVSFDDNDRIVVHEGIMKGLEGQIVKVDRRKGRAKVKLDLYEDSFTVDLAFEVIGRA